MDDLKELERRLLRLKGHDSTISESDLHKRLENLQPETLQSYTYESLQQRFSSLFGSKTTNSPTANTTTATTATTNTTPTTAVDIYLAAIQEQDDWFEDDDDFINWNSSLSSLSSSSLSSSNLNLAQNAFLTGGGELLDNNKDVNSLLAEAQDAVRLSSTSGGIFEYQAVGDEENEDDEIATIIQASKDEALLASKYGHLLPTEEHDKKKKKKKKIKRRSPSSSESDSSESCSSSSESSSSESDSSSSLSSDDDSGKRKGKRKREKKEKKKKKKKKGKGKGKGKGGTFSTTPTLLSATSVSIFKQEEAETLNRLRQAIRAEGKDSKLVRLLAQKLVQLRKSEKNRLQHEVSQMVLNNAMRK
jgi:hypothetical protein